MNIEKGDRVRLGDNEKFLDKKSGADFRGKKGTVFMVLKGLKKALVDLDGHDIEHQQAISIGGYTFISSQIGPVARTGSYIIDLDDLEKTNR